MFVGKSTQQAPYRGGEWFYPYIGQNCLEQRYHRFSFIQEEPLVTGGMGERQCLCERLFRLLHMLLTGMGLCHEQQDLQLAPRAGLTLCLQAPASQRVQRFARLPLCEKPPGEEQRLTLVLGLCERLVRGGGPAGGRPALYSGKIAGGESKPCQIGLD